MKQGFLEFGAAAFFKEVPGGLIDCRFVELKLSPKFEVLAVEVIHCPHRHDIANEFAVVEKPEARVTKSTQQFSRAFAENTDGNLRKVLACLVVVGGPCDDRDWLLRLAGV